MSHKSNLDSILNFDKAVFILEIYQLKINYSKLPLSLLSFTFNKDNEIIYLILKV